MDLITLIVSALATGAEIIGKETVAQAGKEAYASMKDWLLQTFGSNEEIVDGIQRVEDKPEIQSRQSALISELKHVDIQASDQLVVLAKELLEVLNKEGYLTTDRYEAILKGSGTIIQGQDNMGGGERSAVIRKMSGSAATTGDHRPAIKAKTFIQAQHIYQAPPETSVPQSFRQTYLTEVSKETNKLLWSNVSVAYADPEKGEAFTLDDIYTPLDTTALRNVEREDELRQFLAHHHVHERVPAQETVNEKVRVLLMGDPGSGKSTFAKHVAYVLAQVGLAQNPMPWLKKLAPWDHGFLWPVWVELRNVAAFAKTEHVEEGSSHLLLAYLEHRMNQQDISECWPELQTAIRANDDAVFCILDGLDEVSTAAQRQLIVDMVNEVSQRYDRHRYLVTCRPYAYIGQPWRLKEFHEVTLAPFSEEQIDWFVQNWYDRLAQRKRLSLDLADQRKKKLQAASRRHDLRGLAERPLLLTVMTQLHTYKGELPDDRTELNVHAVDLLLKRWESRSETKQGIVEHLNIPGLKMRDVEAGLFEVAFHAHAQCTETDTADIDEGNLLKWLRPYLGGDWNKAAQLVDYIRERAGLLIHHKTEAYTFPHRTFQEFLAACYLVGRPDFSKDVAELLREDASLWKEVFILACGYAARNNQLGQAVAAVNALCPQEFSPEPGEAADVWRRPHIAGEALIEIGLIGVRREPAGQAVLGRIQQALIKTLGQDSILPARDRAEAGQTLGKLGDLREGVINPLKIEWCQVKAGPFLMGEAKQESTIPYDFSISRFPITNAQYQVFVQQGGYEKEDYWPEAKQETIWKAGKIQGRFDKIPRQGPFKLPIPYSLPNYPVVGVTWYEALAFTRWLTEQLRQRGEMPEGWTIQLPNEPEREKAARGTVGQGYPWQGETDPNKANYTETGIGSTNAVGCFPGGKSPFGCEEMSGNVWEWTRSLWSGKAYPVEKVEWKDREHLTAPIEKHRVVRGGAFLSTINGMQCASRYRYHPGRWSNDLGFRVVVSPFSPL